MKITKDNTMEVQTYFIEETKELVWDADKKEEWQAQVKELGLTGQASLTEDNNSPIPFEYINARMKRMFETLCSQQQKVEVYDKTPIPLEVLALIALSEREKYFDYMQIWYDDEAPDPILVGVSYADDSKSDWNAKRYLLARWGAEKVGFEYLEAEALKRIKESVIAKAKKVLDMAKNTMADPEQHALNELNGTNLYYN